ncbi:PQQ-dependent sugar dehydrogenase [Rhizobium sp. C4]|uniref:PQQ-dependent sugar dehydrogenase n=1 Tax=Rhizobium sp. C4 TaxID=1349800 RepID=UPI001E4A325D|nr:PQQ-dependent sugar dehydrogenase [Rhizobium sp. C4]MCD2171912.1 PQQ-dependent sugar dehydrogenase [Rhizobium sp. C4]
MKTTLTAAAMTLTILAASGAPLAALAQVNGATVKESADPPFKLSRVTQFDYPWKIAFLPDGRMLVTEKPGRLWIATQKGQKAEVRGVPKVEYEGQGGLLGVYLSPTFEQDRGVYITYSEPGDGGSSLALARATLSEDDTPALKDLNVIWRDMPKGHGGQFGGAVAFSPDGKYLFLAVGERQRMTPAQDMDLPLGKVLRLTLDGKAAPGNPFETREGAKSVPLIAPPRDTEAAKKAPVVSRYTFPDKNPYPAEIWTLGHRNPYGLAFSPDGRLWGLEHGPRGGDELNLIEPGKNYGWPLVSYSTNYNGVQIPSPDTRPDLTKPVIYWTPVIAPSDLVFYRGDLFKNWKGSALAGGLGSMTLSRITFDGNGGAKPAERWDVGFRVRDVEEGPDGALWMIADDEPGGLYRALPK